MSKPEISKASVNPERDKPHSNTHRRTLAKKHEKDLSVTLPALHCRNCLCAKRRFRTRFWVGEWNLRWQDSDSTEATGTNHIVRELDHKVICENFEAQNGAFAGFIGRSWSVYDTRTQSWKQTWWITRGYLILPAEKTATPLF
ncbi:MAG: hypothetical protein H6574_10330 [Lewinellaceae bacterium]|nr:hypothetical protein [Lewinellaceae bacterium]